jgi:acetyl-CoA carboxylase carboxyltransferase component/biotin carboxyl carrier protein
VGRPVDLKLRGAAYKVTVLRTGPARFRATVDDGTSVYRVEARLTRLGEYAARLTTGDKTYRLVMATHGPVHLVEVDGVAHRVSRDEGGVLRSPAPALVVATPVPVGGEVAAGAPVLVLESMKMETLIPAPFAARIKELLVSAGSQVETGAPLARLEPVGDGEAAEAADDTAPRVSLDLPSSDEPDGIEARARSGIRDLSGMLMGYDIDPGDKGKSLADYLVARDALVAGGLAPLEGELPLLELFADFAELSRNRPAEDAEKSETRIHSPREHFHTYMGTLDPDRGGLPTEFRDRLSRVLAHYGVDGLDRTPELERAVFRVFLAGQRTEPEVALAVGVLRRWLASPPPEGDLVQRARVVLDRLVAATQLRFPLVGDLARSVRFRWFEQPIVEADRAAVLGNVAAELEALDRYPDGPDRAARMEVLADIPERIVSFLGDRLRSGVPAHEPMLAVLIRRHYREHGLTDLREYAVFGRPFASAAYRLDGRDSRLVSTVGRLDEFVPDSALVRALQEEVERGAGQPVVDLYLHAPDLPEDDDAAAAQLIDVAGRLDFVAALRRIAIGVVRGEDAEVGYFTLRPGADGSLTEDLAVRGIHPMVGRRLNLWRLRDFDLTRIAAPRDVLLFDCVARDNAADRRLIALAQVREVVVMRDDDGKVVGLPHVERALANCLEAIRAARTGAGGAGARLDTNQVWIHIWPLIDADVEQLTALRARIAPMTAGAGIQEVRIEGRIAAAGGRSVPGIIAALDLAEERGLPVEWFALSSGARVSMQSGTENMDWVAAALRRIVQFTQAGHEINVVVAGINVGAQPYWNAEATMLMHTKGILVMTPDSAMVLTGKQSLDFSGGVSAEDNFGIGGYDRVMGPNGQAQYWAPNLGAAMGILLGHYDHSYIASGEDAPRRAVSVDPVDRDVSDYPHAAEGSEFTTVGEIFSHAKNPDRKKPFDIRTVIAAVCDADHPRVERWAGMADAETAVVMDARVGGHAVCVLGIESKPVPRQGFPPTDGPDTYTGGTLFPRSSKKAARAINAASGNRPLVVLANLSGFDGSPESMRNLQLEYGAEIGRAIVNFSGPIVFVVISRYHGGAFVVFSKRLNENMTVLAIEGSFASVLGGAPAAAVVFAGDVAKRTASDPRVASLEAQLREAPAETRRGAVAVGAGRGPQGRCARRRSPRWRAEFDGVHSIHRAVEVGSVDISPHDLRPRIIAALDMG